MMSHSVPYRMAWFDNFVRKYISEGFSLMAWDTNLDRMVGVAIFTQCKRTYEKHDNDPTVPMRAKKRTYCRVTVKIHRLREG